MIVPPRLTKESRIKVILPASGLKSDSAMKRRFSRGYNLLQKHFTLENSRFWQAESQGFAADDHDRAAEISDAFRSPKIGAIIAARGGYGCLRLLPLIDYDLVKQRPKILIGFSDITILQLAIYQRTGLVSLSGPMVSTLNRSNLELLRPLLTEDLNSRDLIPAAYKKDIEVMNPGKAEGVLLGGNLFSLVQLIGTGFLPRLDSAILFIEDVNETVDHLDSYLHHLKLAGLLYQVTGVVIGDLSWRKGGALLARRKQRELFKQRIAGIFRKEVPVMIGVNYGHVKNSITIPVGARAELNTETRSLVLTENASHA